MHARIIMNGRHGVFGRVAETRCANCIGYEGGLDVGLRSVDEFNSFYAIDGEPGT